VGPCDDATTAADGKGCQHRHRRLASSALFLRLLFQFNRCRVAIDGVGPGRPSSKSLGGTAGPSRLPRASFGIERALLALERGVIFFFRARRSRSKTLFVLSRRFVGRLRTRLPSRFSFLSPSFLCPQCKGILFNSLLSLASSAPRGPAGCERHRQRGRGACVNQGKSLERPSRNARRKQPVVAAGQRPGQARPRPELRWARRDRRVR